MELSADILRRFAEVTTPDKETRLDNTVYGVVKELDSGDGIIKVLIDGADPDVLTPASYTATVAVDDRVLVTLKNRSAIVTGNLTNPEGEPPGYSALVANVNSHISNSSVHFSLQSVYPVGSVYIQFGVNLDSPATLFGFGTWQEILTQASGQSDQSPKYHMWVRTA